MEGEKDTFVVVTRHQGLVEFLKELGLEVGKVLPHAQAEDIRGRNVVGVLPYHLAELAENVAAVHLYPPPGRGEDLPLEEVRKRFAGLESFVVMGPTRFEQIKDELLESYGALGEARVVERLRSFLEKPVDGVVGVARGGEMAELVRSVLPEGAPLLGEVGDPEALKGKVVYGHLPLHLAKNAAMVMVPELHLKEEERGKTLSAEELKERATWTAYTVYSTQEYMLRMGMVLQNLDFDQREARIEETKTRVLEQWKGPQV